MKSLVIGNFVMVMVLLAVAGRGDTVKLNTRYGYWVTSVGDTAGTVNASTWSNQYNVRASETFTLIDSECLKAGDTISLRASNGKYLGISSTGALQALATSSGVAEAKFSIAASSELQPGTGVIPRPASITLKAANGNYVCGGSDGVLRANCANPEDNAYFNATIEGGTWGSSLTVTPVLNNGSPIKVGTQVTITANTAGGVAGTNQYQFIVKNAAGTIVYPASPTQPSFSGTYYASWMLSAAGNYTASVQVRRYCQGSGPLFDATGTATQAVTTVAFGTNAAEMKRGSSQTIRWTFTNPPTQFKNGSLQIFDPATYTTTDINTSIADITTGSTFWTVPADFPLVSGKLRLTSFANANLQWDSGSTVTIKPADVQPLQWTWTTRLTPEHFNQLGLSVALTTEQVNKLNSQTYTIASIINSGSAYSTTDRLYDTNKCANCHTATGSYKYRPAYPVAKDSSIPRGDGTNYSWNQATATGIVQRFIDSGINKPEMLEKLFSKWLALGAQ